MPATANIVDEINLVVRTRQRLLLELGRRPTLAELAARLGMSPAQVERLLAIARNPALAA